MSLILQCDELSTITLDSGNVVSWADRSGAGNDLTQSAADAITQDAAVQNGLAAISLPGGTASLRTTGGVLSGTGSFTCVTVFRITVSAFAAIAGKVFPAAPPSYRALYTNGSNLVDSSGTDIVGAALDAAWHVSVSVYGGTTRTWYLDGANQGALTESIDFESTPYGIGHFEDSWIDGMAGYVGEVRVYDSAEDAAALWVELAAKWAIAATSGSRRRRLLS